MSEEAEVYKVLREESQKKKRDNMIKSTELLESKGVPFTSHNNGVHLIVDDHIDFWPSTGKWKDRNNNKVKRGVFNLIEYLLKNDKLTLKF
jgi:hypothetical protein